MRLMLMVMVILLVIVIVQLTCLSSCTVHAPFTPHGADSPLVPSPTPPSHPTTTPLPSTATKNWKSSERCSR